MPAGRLVPKDKMPLQKTILSLFCGCGGLDLGFENAGYKTGLAYDRRPDAVSSWNRNRSTKVAREFDVQKLSLERLDEHYGSEFKPVGVIGGPPCQGFSLANRNGSEHDPRNRLVKDFFAIALELDERSPLDFIVMENVPSIEGSRGGGILAEISEKLRDRGFAVRQRVLDAANFGVAQHRRRLFLFAVKKQAGLEPDWQSPIESEGIRTVRDEIGSLPAPLFFHRGNSAGPKPWHENHWCMTPKSTKFFDGTLHEGYTDRRSFKTLWWDKPSYTVSYGNREVHVHPSATRRLSVYEGMLLQGFPHEFVLNGTMSSQITQVSEAVPPPLAFAVADSLRRTLELPYSAAA